ncbi:restriction endonuclease [Bacillus sp. UMB0899]|nr:restriction endonuclease [Bacillus sp. UMB0899]
MEFLKNLKLKRSGMLEVDKMRGRRFEEYLRLLLVHRGYKVRLTPATGDYGADLILTLNDKTIIVQAKRYKKKVGLKAVQEIATAKSHYKANECWVITNNYFTKPAVELASSNKVRLIDRNQLMKWMLERNKSA